MQGFKSNSRCVDKEDVVCIESGMLFSHNKKKKERNFAICSNMDGPGGYYAKRISQRKKKTVWYHLHVQSKNLQQKSSRLAGVESKLVAFQRRGELEGDTGMGEQEAPATGVNQAWGCVAQYGKYSQYFVITVNGK